LLFYYKFDNLHIFLNKLVNDKNYVIYILFILYFNHDPWTRLLFNVSKPIQIMLFTFYLFYILGMVHVHDCYLTSQSINKTIWNTTNEERYVRTMQKNEYITHQCYTAICKWECEFANDIKKNKDLALFLKRFERPLDCKTYLTEKDVIDAVKK
jgi:hypothetical protein